MAAPVWLLTVDLQTKTASFTTGLADAAKSARGAFRNIQSGAGEMGDATAHSFGNTRAAIGLLDNTIRGAHTMAMADVIRLFHDSSLVMAAMPFAATAAGFALVAEMAYKGVQAYEAVREEQEKLRDGSIKLHTTMDDTLNGLDTKLLQAEKQSDELAGNHLAALHKELMLIDKTSLEDLRHSFDAVAKEADSFFAQLKAHWYEAGIGSEGARHALDGFQTQYESLLAQGKSEQASGLLRGTLAQAQEVLRLQQIADAGEHGNRYDSDEAYQRAFAADKAVAELKKLGAGYASKEIEAQRALVDALQAQVEAEAKVAAIKKVAGQNAVTQERKETGKDVGSLLQENEKAERGFNENLKQYEQQRVAITTEGSWQRVEALRSALNDVRSLFGEDSVLYREFATAEVKAYNDAADKQLQEISNNLQEQARLKTEAAREEAANTEKMGLLRIVAEKQQMALENSAHRVGMDQRIAQETELANEEYRVKMTYLESEIAALDKTGADYLNKLKQLQDQETELTKQHQNELAAIKDKATEQSNQALISSYQRMVQVTSQGLTESIMRHQYWSQMLVHLGDEVIGSMLQNAIQSAMLDDFDKERDAAKAARKMFLAGAQLPFPVNIVMAPVLAAGAFATVMAFATGTDAVPGVGRGDVVPAMLTPGEGIVPGGVMDGLRNVARNGGFDQRPSVHVHGVHFAPTVHALDADGVDEVLTKHEATFQRHFESTLARMNR